MRFRFIFVALFTGRIKFADLNTLNFNREMNSRPFIQSVFIGLPSNGSVLVAVVVVFVRVVFIFLLLLFCYYVHVLCVWTHSIHLQVFLSVYACAVSEVDYTLHEHIHSFHKMCWTELTIMESYLCVYACLSECAV